MQRDSWQRAIQSIQGLSLLLLVGCGWVAAPSRTPVLLQGRLDGGFEAEATKVGYRAFMGIQHTHVAEGGDDGQGTLAEAYTFARERARLDFMGVSSHSHMISDAGYRNLAKAAEAFTEPGRFVALVAQEWSSISKGGHINILEARERCGLENGAWDDFYRHWLPNHPEVAAVQFNHPHPSNPLEFGGLRFSPTLESRPSVVAHDKVTGIALLNGPGKYEKADMAGEPEEWDRGVNGLNYEAEYLDFLNRGWRIGAVADQDNHVKNWGLACPTRTGVWAKSLNRGEILDAFRARRTFAAIDPNLKLWFSINGQDMGAEILGTKELQVRIAASDPDTVIQRLELYGDTDGVGGKPAQIIASTKVGQKVARWVLNVPAPDGDAYYFAKLIINDQKAWAWSSPIWITHNQTKAKRQRR
jgi:hypothetical protein